MSQEYNEGTESKEDSKDKAHHRFLELCELLGQKGLNRRDDELLLISHDKLSEAAKAFLCAVRECMENNWGWDESIVDTEMIACLAFASVGEGADRKKISDLIALREELATTLVFRVRAEELSCDDRIKFERGLEKTERLFLEISDEVKGIIERKSLSPVQVEILEALIDTSFIVSACEMDKEFEELSDLLSSFFGPHRPSAGS